MAIPTPRSFAQILGEMLESFASQNDITGIKPGSPLLAFFQAVAQSDAKNAQEIFSLLAALDIDRSVGPDLDRLGRGEGIERLAPTYATGVVTVRDSTFTKVSGQLWTGAMPPIPGSTIIHVSASNWPTTGQLYIGRGTANVEGPLAFSGAVESTPGVWTITLSVPATKSHYAEDEVVLAANGDRVISSGQTFSTVPAAGSQSVSFSVTEQVTLFDGEDTVFNVPVRAQTPGTDGNVAADSITAVTNEPFAGCVVTNPTAFSSARNVEDDLQYRNRIKMARRSKSRGTIDAIQSAVTGASSPDEAATVQSASVVRRLGKPDVLYIDDGTGYEPKAAGVGYELILPAGAAAVDRVALGRTPVAKAAVTCKTAAPYSIVAGASLKVKVGGVESTHYFDVSKFLGPQGTAYEVASSINANATLLFSAKTSGSGRYVTLRPKAESASIQVTGGTANDALGFPTHRVEDVFLYQNDRAMSGYTLDRNLSQIEFPSPVSGKITAGTKYTNGFVSETVAKDLKLFLDGASSVMYTTPDEGGSVRWTFTLGSPFAKVEVGAGNFVAAATAFSSCRPGDVLVYNQSVTVGIAGSLPSTYSPKICYVPAGGSYVIVECPVAGANETSVTTGTNLSVWRTATVAQPVSVGGDPAIVEASVFGATYSANNGEYRLTTANPEGDAAASIVTGVGAAPQMAPSTQPHFAYLKSKVGLVPAFDWWRYANTNATQTQMVVEAGHDPIAGDDYRAFGVKVGRPMPYGTVAADFYSLYRQGFSAGRILELTGYSGTTLNYRNEIGGGVYVDTGSGVGYYGSSMTLGRYYDLYPNDAIQIAINGRKPGTSVALYTSCLTNSIGGYGNTMTFTTNGNKLPTVFGTDFDFVGFAVHQRPKCLLDVKDGGGTIAAIGSVLAIAPLSTGPNAGMAIAPPNDPATTIDTENGTYIVRHHIPLANTTPVSPTVPGDETYKVAVIAGPTAQANKMTFQYAWNVVKAVRSTNVTTIHFAKGDFTASNPFASDTSVYITLNNVNFTDSGSPQAIVATGSSGGNWTLSFNDPGADITVDPIANGWVSTSLVAPAATPATFSELNANVATGLDWIKVLTPPSYAPFYMDDTYPLYAKGTGSFSLLVESSKYGTALYTTGTPVGPWGTGMFVAYASSASLTDVAAATSTEFPVQASSGLGISVTKIPYDTRHEWLLGYRSNPYARLTDEVNYVGEASLVGDNYELTLKTPINPNLTGFYGSGTEPFYLVPSTPKNVSDFVSKTSPFKMDRTAAGALVLSSETLGAASGVEVTGGTGNDTSLEITPHLTSRTQFYVSERAGLSGGSWVKLTSPAPQAKSIFSNTGTISVSGGVVTATMDGAVGACSYAGTVASPLYGGRWYLEPMGEFTGFYWTGTAVPVANFGTVQPGDWVTIDPGVGSWSPTSIVNTLPTNPTSIALSNGKIARFGGIVSGVVAPWVSVFDPQTGIWAADFSLPSARVGHTATLLPDGKVLIVGGSTNNTSAGATDTAWVVDMVSHVSTAVTLPVPKKLWLHTTTLLPNGKIVVCGGKDQAGADSNTWYIFNYNSTTPANSTWSSPVRTMNAARSGHRAIAVQSDKALLVCGSAQEYELLDVTNQALYLLGTLPAVMDGAALLPGTNKVLLYGHPTASSKAFGVVDWVGGSYTSGGTTPDAMRYVDSVVSDGKVYCFGASSGTEFVGAVFDIASGTWVRMAPRFNAGFVGRNSHVGSSLGIVATAGRPEVYSASATSSIGGTYQVSQVLSNGSRHSFWIAGDLGAKDASIAFMEFRRYDSIMPGDTVTVTTNVLGASNVGVFTVTSVAGDSTFTTTPSMADVAPTVLGASYLGVSVMPASVTHFVRKLDWVGIETPGEAKIVCGIATAAAPYRNENAVQAGWVVSQLGKLGFSSAASYGVDAYSYHTGLTQEVNRIMYGDPSDPMLHPGVVAAGARVEIDGPQVKQVKVSVQIRGERSASLASNVQAAVVKAVNSTPVGVSVAISDIVTAANSVPGVTSVAVALPTYSTSNDLIEVQPFEKAMVLTTNDVSVVFSEN